MNNPFEPINTRLSNLETLALEILRLVRSQSQTVDLVIPKPEALSGQKDKQSRKEVANG